MRFSTVSILSALSSLALAQNLLSGLPTCAQTCFGTSFGDCSPLDIKCICSNSSLISSLSCCVAGACSSDDQSKTIKFAANLCQANGVTVPTTASCAASSGASSTSAASSSGSSKASGTTSGSMSITSGASSSSATGANASAASTPGSSGAAAHHTAAVGMGAAMAGLLMAL